MSEREPLHLDERDEDLVREAGARRVGLCIVEVDAGLEEAVAKVYIEAALPSANARLIDARVVAPESGGWRIEEIDNEIIAPSLRRPSICNVLVVRAGDSLSVAGRDRVLKTLEEPAARSSFCFLVRDTGALGATILGRAGATLRVHSSDDEIRARFVESGVDEDVLARYGGYWKGWLGLLDDVQASDVADLLVSSELWKERSWVKVAALTGVFERIGSDPASKRRARLICGAWMSSMSAHVGAYVQGGGDPLWAQSVLDGVVAARENLTYNSPLGIVIARAVAGGD